MAGEFQQRELSGSLFKNDRKEQANHPDYKGSTLIEGVEYWVSGWIKDGARGKWLSVAFQPKQAKQAQYASATQKAPPPKFDEDDIPF